MPKTLKGQSRFLRMISGDVSATKRSAAERPIHPTFRRPKRERGGEARLLSRVFAGGIVGARLGGDGARGEQSFARLLGRVGRSRSGGKYYTRGRGRVYPDSPRGLQRVLIKARVVRNRSYSGRSRKVSALAVHLNYLEREGVGLAGERGRAFSIGGSLSTEQRHGWVQAASKDRHHFRFIVSPERGAELDLESFAKQLICQMEEDLGTKLSALAVVHHNTDNPHIHLLVRGRTEDGEDLVINRHYISHGLRAVASRLATKELGLRHVTEIKAETERSVTATRFTGLDAELLQSANDSQVVDLTNPNKRQKQRLTLLIGRLQFLSSLGLAEEEAVGVWRLAEGVQEKLRALGLREDVIKRMHESLRSRGEKPYSGEPLWSLKGEQKRGVIVSLALLDELGEMAQLVVKTERGEFLSVAVPMSAVGGFEEGSQVTVSAGQLRGRNVVRGTLFGDRREQVLVRLEQREKQQHRQADTRSRAFYNQEQQEQQESKDQPRRSRNQSQQSKDSGPEVAQTEATQRSSFLTRVLGRVGRGWER